MAKYRGSGLIVEWINPLGTVIMATPQTNLDVARDCDLIDVSSGNDADHEFITGLKKGTATLKFFDDTTTGATGGTAIAAAMVEGTYGTLLWGPQGTVTGKPKGGMTAYVKSLKHQIPFDKAIDLEIAFEKSGALLFDFGSSWP